MGTCVRARLLAGPPNRLLFASRPFQEVVIVHFHLLPNKLHPPRDAETCQAHCSILGLTHSPQQTSVNLCPKVRKDRLLNLNEASVTPLTWGHKVQGSGVERCSPESSKLSRSFQLKKYSTSHKIKMKAVGI